MVMEEIVKNVHLLHRQRIASKRLTCTDLALYSLVGRKVERNEDRGRPRLDTPKDVLVSERNGNMVWSACITNTLQPYLDCYSTI